VNPRRLSPLGACPACRGFGRIISIDYGLALPDRSKTLAEALHMPGAADVEFSPPKADWMPKPAEFD